ncbi:MAG TPA: DUF4097 family beta strand repeat-containing protein [Candidatus Saccharimonadales bacterium]|nr:DUF4097 family beta strand repeat-containing protein [Candidatus Saccharimonadales bacterium]
MAIALFGDVRIESNKPGDISINGHKIEFQDGSWYNTHTGEYHNAGSEPIYVNGVPLGDATDQPATDTDETVSTEERPYQATKLELAGVRADVKVESHSGPGMIVVVTGTEAQRQSVICKMLGSTLRVSGGSGGSGSAIYQASGDSFAANTIIGSVFRGSRGMQINMFDDGGDSFVSVSTGKSAGTLTVVVKVPVGTQLDVTVDSHDLTIGDIMGPLTAVTTASGDISVGRVTDVNLTSHGSGGIDVAEVNGHAKLMTHGSGGMTIDDGQINELTAFTHASGDIKVDTTAQWAHLRSYGSGDIKVKRVVGEVHERRRGSGEIKVRNRGLKV